LNEAANAGKCRPLFYAFDKLPKITPVPEYTRADSTPATQESSGHLTCDKPGVKCVADHRFGAPAHFPMPQFGSAQGELLESSALVIYEGMRFRICSDGRYEVRFIATTPDIPVTLR